MMYLDAPGRSKDIYPAIRSGGQHLTSAKHHQIDGASAFAMPGCIACNYCKVLQIDDSLLSIIERLQCERNSLELPVVDTRCVDHALLVNHKPISGRSHD